MAGEVLFDLTLGFGEESEIPAVTQDPGGHPERKRSRIPQRIEQAGASAELADALRAPGEMIALLPGGALERRARPVLPRHQRLAFVQRLRAYLAHMVDAHQRRGMDPGCFGEPGIGKRLRGRWPPGIVNPGERAQGPVETGDQPVHTAV